MAAMRSILSVSRACLLNSTLRAGNRVVDENVGLLAGDRRQTKD